MLGEAIQIIDRRVLVLKNEEKTRLRAKITYMFRRRGIPTPPGYGYLTRHLDTGRLMLGKAVQTINRRVLVLENKEKNTAPCQNYIHVQASTATINKDTGIRSAITNGTPVPPPQVRTNPTPWGKACGAT